MPNFQKQFYCKIFDVYTEVAKSKMYYVQMIQSRIVYRLLRTNCSCDATYNADTLLCTMTQAVLNISFISEAEVSSYYAITFITV